MLASLRILALAFMWSLVMLAIACYFVFSIDPITAPPLPWLAVVVGLAIAVHLLVSTVGYRVFDAAASTDPQAAATAFRAAFFLRVALSESVAILALALAFIVESGGYALFLVGAGCSLLLMGWHVWPGERVIERFESNLTARGGRTGVLRQGLGLPSGGAIRRL